MRSQGELLRDDADRVLRRRDREGDRARVIGDLVVIAARERLVAEEVDLLEAVAGDLRQAEALVPAQRVDVEGNLSADGELELVVGELGLERLDELVPDLVLLK